MPARHKNGDCRLQSEELQRCRPGQGQDDASGHLADICAPQNAPARDGRRGRKDSDPFVVRRALSELRPHPAYVKGGLSVGTSKMNELECLGDSVFEHPITTTQDGIVIDGYARWELAKKRGMATILCLVLQRTEEEALRDFLWMHKTFRGLNNFRRIELSQDLRPQATLESSAQVDWAKARAGILGVSLGSVRKVHRVLEHGCWSTITAARDAEISIHRAAGWCQQSEEEQIDNLRRLRIERIRQKSRYLVNRVSLCRSTAHEGKLTPKTLLVLLEPLACIIHQS